MKKRFFKAFSASFVILTILLSFAVMPANASGFSSANIASRGIRTFEKTDGTSDTTLIKCNSGSSSNYSRYHDGSGASRVVIATMKQAFKSSTRIIDNACNTEVAAHFVHARTMFSIKQVGSEKIVFRVNFMSTDWNSQNNPAFNIVVPSSGGTGYISAYGGTGKGVTDNDQCFYYTGETGAANANGARDCVNHVTGDTPSYQVMDLIVDCNKGYAYCYVDGRLIATHTEAIKNADGVYRGYSIIGSNSETVNAKDTKLWVKYDPERPGDTVYVDTEDYTVRLEDVLVDAGLADNNGNPNQIMESDHISDYIFAGTFTEADNKTYERRIGGKTVSMTAEKTLGDYGNVAQLYGGCYLKGKDWPGYAHGKGVIHVSFDQKINETMNSGDTAASNNYCFRLVAQGMKNYDLLYMQPQEGTEKMQLTLIQQKGDNNPKTVLDKDFNDTIHYDIVLYGKHYSTAPATEHAEGMGYYFADGKYIGSYKLNRGGSSGVDGEDEWWTPTQLLLYSNSTANVTYSNYKFELYGEKMDAEDLVAELGNVKPSWKNILLHSGTGANEGYFTISGKIKAGKEEVPADTKAYIGLYDREGNLLDCDDVDYTTETDIETKNFQKDYNGKTPKTARLFMWSGIEPQALCEKTVISPKFDSGTIYVLAIGNSFSQDSVRKLSEIAAADGVNIIPYNAYKAGLWLKHHYNAWVNDTAGYYRVEPYGVSNGTYKSTREFLQYQDWDYIMLQGATHNADYDTDLWGDNGDYWTTLRDGIAGLCPNAKRLVHATWAPINEFAAQINDGMFADGTPDSRGAYLTALLPHEQFGANIYSTETRANGGKEYIPTAVAIDYLVRHYRFPEYEGERDSDNKYDNSETTRGIYRDTTCHLTDNVGKVLAGLVWYEMITGVPATENAYQRDTLSKSDMAALKDAAHYACQNYTTYNPELIMPIESVDVPASVMKSKNGADATVVFIHDDGARATVEFLNEEFPKYNINGTIGIIGNKLTGSALSMWETLLEASNGRLNFASHSYNHEYFGESDSAESGTLSDGTEYSYAAGHLTQEIANERSRINGLFPNERVLTFIKPGVKYPNGKKQVSDAAMSMIQEHYIAMRNTGGGVDNIPPADIYSVKSLMGRYNPDYTNDEYQSASYWKEYLDEAISKKGLLVYLFHNIYDDFEASGLFVSKTRISNLFKTMGDDIEEGKIWNAKFDEAMQYAVEYGANPQATATAYYEGTPCIRVGVTDDISRIDTDEVGKFKGLDMFDYPLTVKVTVPFDWTYVKLTQSYNDRVEIAKTFTEGGKRYVYANVVPDKASAMLTEAAASDYVSGISAGGSLISGFDPAKFYYNVELPYGTTSAPNVTTTSGRVLQASLSDGEGSAFVTLDKLKYEVHFSVAKQGPSVLLRIDPSLDDSSYTATKKVVAELKNRGISANITNSACYSALSGSYDNVVYCTYSGADTCSFEFDDTYTSGKMVEYKQFTASYNGASGSRLVMTMHPNSKGSATYDDRLFGTFKDQLDFLIMQGVTFVTE